MLFELIFLMLELIILCVCVQKKKKKQIGTCVKTGEMYSFENCLIVLENWAK